MGLIRVETSHLIYRIAVITARNNATAPFTARLSAHSWIIRHSHASSRIKPTRKNLRIQIFQLRARFPSSNVRVRQAHTRPIYRTHVSEIEFGGCNGTLLYALSCDGAGGRSSIKCGWQTSERQGQDQRKFGRTAVTNEVRRCKNAVL